MKVLAIEEDSFIRAVYESELRQENIEVVTASNGREGLLRARETNPDLIITELILTKLNGFELIKEIRQKEKKAISNKASSDELATREKQAIDEAKLSGVDLTNETKSKDKKKLLSNVPIVVVSALSQKQDIDEAISLGATKYLPKDLFSAKQAVKEVLNLMMSLL